MKEVKIKNKIIGDVNPTFIIAEMAWSFDGSIEKAKKIVDASFQANVDAICLHITSMKDYMAKDYRLNEKYNYDFFEKTNLSFDEWEEIISYAKSKGLIICAMCNDLTSVEFCKNKTDAYIIPPASFCEHNFIKKVAKKGKPIFLRIGGATLGEIEKVFLMIKKEGNENIVLIHGFQSYPTPLEEMNLRYINTLKKLFGCPVGFADHTDAESEFALVIPLIAIAMGANVIEKHITYDRSFRGLDYESALNPDEMKILVKMIRKIEKSFGSAYVRKLTERELKYREICRKRVVACRDIEKGEIITEDKITLKRANTGVYPDEIKYLVGRKAKIKIEKDCGITFDMVE
jgi:sialic acid synthase SpsE